MNKLNKIFLGIIVILVIVIIAITYLYFNMRETAKKNLNGYVEVASLLYDITSSNKPNNESVIEFVKSVEDPKERKTLIDIYVENGDLTEEVANELY